MRHHDQLIVQSRAMIRIKKRRAIPRLWNAELENVRSERGSVAFIFPQIIRAQIRQYQRQTDYCQERKWPMRAQSTPRFKDLHLLNSQSGSCCIATGNWRTSHGENQEEAGANEKERDA